MQIVDSGGCTLWILDIEQSQQLALSTICTCSGELKIRQIFIVFYCPILSSFLLKTHWIFY